MKMKKYPKVTILMIIFVVTGALFSTLHQEECMAKEFDAALNVMGYDRDVTIKNQWRSFEENKGGTISFGQAFLSE